MSSAPCVAQPPTEAPAATPKAGEAAEKPEGTLDPTPAATSIPRVSEETCKDTVGKLRSGDFSALESLSEGQRGMLLAGSTGLDVLTCLAIAEDDGTRCDSLDKEGKKSCVEQWKVGRELKGVPKEKVKAQLLYRTCASTSPDMNCDAIREAIGTKDPGKCKEKVAAKQTFCTAVAASDPKKCASLEGVERAYCEAFASDDSSRCPKEATDCIAMARGFAALKKGGLEGFQEIDARIAAATMGTKACAALLTNLESTCGKDE